jgi:tetratricopeptide (TPR) repeat protein
MFENAVSLDKTFALAYARLASAQANLHFQSERGMSTRWQEAERSLARAFALEPHLPEAYLAKGLIHNLVYRQYDSALASYAHAEEGVGNPSDYYSAIALVERRQGDWLASLDHHRKAVELDPRSAVKMTDLSDICLDMRRNEEAVHYARRAITLQPDDPWGYQWLVVALIAGGNGLDEIRNLLQEASALVDPAEVLLQDVVFPLGLVRLGVWDEVAENPASIPRRTYSKFEIHNYYLAVGQIYDNLGESEQARIYLDSARVDLTTKLDEHHALIAQSGFRHQEDFGLHHALGTVYAYLGEKDLAISEGLRAVELMPSSDCFW